MLDNKFKDYFYKEKLGKGLFTVRGFLSVILFFKRVTLYLVRTTQHKVF